MKTINIKVHERLKGMTTKLGKKFLPIREVEQLLKQILALGIASAKPRNYLKKEKEESGINTNVKDTQISLKITIDDLTNALKDDSLMGKFLDSFN
jgi:hypothetical protein